MMKSKSGIVVSVMVVALQSAWGGNGSEANAGTPPNANSPIAENFIANPAGGQLSATGTVQAVSRLGGIWAGKALIGTGRPPSPPAEFAARGLIAADGTGYFLISHTVLRAQLAGWGGFLHGAPLVGTAPEISIYPPGVHVIEVQGSMPKQALDLRWCLSRYYLPHDPCPPGWNQLALKYDRWYESGSSLARIAGHYVDTRGQYKGVLTIAGDGYLFMQDPATGCVVNGRVAIINRTYSIYSIKLSYANCRSPAWSGGTFTGLVSYDGGTRQLFALMLGTAANRAAGNMLNFVRQ